MQKTGTCTVSCKLVVAWTLTVFVLFCSSIGLAQVAAQDTIPPNVPDRPAAQPLAARGPDLSAVDAGVKSDDNFQVQQALDSAVALLADERNGPKAADKVPQWLHMLVQQRRFEDVEDFALAAINARPADLRLIEACQQSRIRAKLLSNKPQEALPIAKSLYDVCAMPDTSKAIDLISECLYDIDTEGNAAAADPAMRVKKFKLEQIHGAAATQPSTDPNTLAQIQVDAKPYSAGLAKVDLDENGWEASMGKGNLLLLAGQPAEAVKVFQKAYALASDNNLAAATEAVARAMRAEDGTVGRANAWILSLRPPEQAAQ